MFSSLPNQTARQFLPQLPPRPVEPRITCPRRELQNPGDILVGKPIDVPEGQDNPIFLLEARQSRLDDLSASFLDPLLFKAFVFSGQGLLAHILNGYLFLAPLVLIPFDQDSERLAVSRLRPQDEFFLVHS